MVFEASCGVRNISSTSSGKSRESSKLEMDPEMWFESEAKDADSGGIDLRARKGNTRINYEEIVAEKLHRLKETRKGFKLALTRKMKESEMLLSKNEDPERVKIKLKEVDAMMVKFEKSHTEYHTLQSEREEREEAQKYFDAVASRLGCLKAIITRWVEEMETNQNLLSPFDLVSQAGDRHSSGASRRSEKSSVATSRIGLATNISKKFLNIFLCFL